jgi:hypothetical protein
VQIAAQLGPAKFPSLPCASRLSGYLQPQRAEEAAAQRQGAGIRASESGRDEDRRAATGPGGRQHESPVTITITGGGIPASERVVWVEAECHTRFPKGNQMHLICVPGSSSTHMIDEMSVIS